MLRWTPGDNTMGGPRWSRSPSEDARGPRWSRSPLRGPWWSRSPGGLWWRRSPPAAQKGPWWSRSPPEDHRGSWWSRCPPGGPWWSRSPPGGPWWPPVKTEATKFLRTSAFSTAQWSTSEKVDGLHGWVVLSAHHNPNWVTGLGEKTPEELQGVSRGGLHPKVTFDHMISTTFTLSSSPPTPHWGSPRGSAAPVGEVFSSITPPPPWWPLGPSPGATWRPPRRSHHEGHQSSGEDLGPGVGRGTPSVLGGVSGNQFVLGGGGGRAGG